MTLPQLVEQIRVDTLALSTNIGVYLKAQLGTATLTTTAQTIKGAINELKAGIANAVGINDTTPSTTTTYSSTKVDTLLIGKLGTGAALPAAQITGTISLSNLPVLPGTNSEVATTISALTTPQQTAITVGSIVIESSTGRAFRYSGTGSKIVEASYIFIADVTPDWTTITSKPTTLAGYGITDALSTADIGTPNTAFSTAFTTALV